MINTILASAQTTSQWSSPLWNCQTLHKSLEITNALIAVHVTSQTLYMYTEITNAVHVTSLPGSLYVCLHFATAHVPILTY